MADIDRLGIARRLRAVMIHLEMDTVQEFASAIGAERSAVSNWLNANTSGNPPRVPLMLRLIQLVPGLTLDWIYTGKADGMTMALAVRLIALAAQDRIPESRADPEGGGSTPLAFSVHRRHVQSAT